MANNRGRNKPKRAPSTPAQPTSGTTQAAGGQNPPEPTNQSRRSSFLAKFVGLLKVSVVLSALEIAGTIGNLWGPIWPASPVVQVQNLEKANPFVLRFSISNPSVFFGMNRVQLSCYLGNVQFTENHGFVQGITTFSNAKTSTIEAEKSVLYLCPYNGLFDLPWSFESAEIAVNVEYRTLFFRRRKSEQFTWNKQTQVWVKGKLIN